MSGNILQLLYCTVCSPLSMIDLSIPDVVISVETTPCTGRARFMDISLDHETKVCVTHDLDEDDNLFDLTRL